LRNKKKKKRKKNKKEREGRKYRELGRCEEASEPSIMTHRRWKGRRTCATRVTVKSARTDIRFLVGCESPSESQSSLDMARARARATWKEGHVRRVSSSREERKRDAFASRRISSLAINEPVICLVVNSARDGSYEGAKRVNRRHARRAKETRERR